MSKKERIEQLETRITEMQAEIAALNARIAALEARPWCPPGYVIPEYPIPGRGYLLYSKTNDNTAELDNTVEIIGGTESQFTVLTRYDKIRGENERG